MPKKSRQNRLPGEAYAPGIHARLWLIDAAGEHYLGVGKVRLMEAIDELGSISHAARTLGMSYKRAWSLIQEVNQLEDEPYVAKEVGGAGGGHATVTDTGLVCRAADLSASGSRDYLSLDGRAFDAGEN